MGPESVSLWFAILGIITVIDLIAGGKYLFTVRQFLRRLTLSIAIFTIVVVAKNNAEVAAYIHQALYYVMIIVGLIIIFVILYDMFKIIIKSEELNYRRNKKRHRHSSYRTTTPTRH